VNGLLTLEVAVSEVAPPLVLVVGDAQVDGPVPEPDETELDGRVPYPVVPYPVVLPYPYPVPVVVPPKSGVDLLPVTYGLGDLGPPGAEPDLVCPPCPISELVAVAVRSSKNAIKSPARLPPSGPTPFPGSVLDLVCGDDPPTSAVDLLNASGVGFAGLVTPIPTPPGEKE